MTDCKKAVFFASLILTVSLVYFGKSFVDHSLNIEFSFKFGPGHNLIKKRLENVTLSRVSCATTKKEQFVKSALMLDKNCQPMFDPEQLHCLTVLTNKTGVYKFLDGSNFQGLHCNKSIDKRFLKPGEMMTTVLASFPGSGNTWTRHLLEELTGIYTGSVSNDGKLNQTFRGEGQTENVLVVKTHRFPENVTYLNFSRTILLIRDPFESLLSYFNYVSKGHTGILSKKESMNYSFQDFAKRNIKIYKMFHFEWLMKYRGSLYVLYYKDLKQDLLNTLVRLSSFLGTNVTLKQLWCVNKQQTGRFKRGPKPVWQDRSKLVNAEIGLNLSTIQQEMTRNLKVRVRIAKNFIVF